jgi:hypothetical protein
MSSKRPSSPRTRGTRPSSGTAGRRHGGRKYAVHLLYRKFTSRIGDAGLRRQVTDTLTKAPGAIRHRYFLGRITDGRAGEAQLFKTRGHAIAAYEALHDTDIEGAFGQPVTLELATLSTANPNRIFLDPGRKVVWSREFEPVRRGSARDQGASRRDAGTRSVVDLRLERFMKRIGEIYKRGTKGHSGGRVHAVGARVLRALGMSAAEFRKEQLRRRARAARSWTAEGIRSALVLAVPDGTERLLNGFGSDLPEAAYSGLVDRYVKVRASWGERYANFLRRGYRIGYEAAHGRRSFTALRREFGVVMDKMRPVLRRLRGEAEARPRAKHGTRAGTRS